MKIKHVMAVIIRAAVFLLPGAITAFFLWGSHGWWVAILAALGVEFVAGILLTFILTVAAQIKARRELEREKADKE